MTGPVNTQVQWTASTDDGFEGITIPNDQYIFEDIAPERSAFVLTIPRRSPSYPGLQPSKSYKFIATASSPGDKDKEEAFASTIIKTKSAPGKGVVEVSPTSGRALETVFKVTAKWPSPDATEFSYSLYIKAGKEWKLLEEAHTETAMDETGLVTIKTLLPGSSKPIWLAYKACNIDGICSEFTKIGPVSVSLHQITNKDFRLVHIFFLIFFQR